MKTLRLHGVGDVRLTDESVPEPSSGEELVRVSAVGICGSDLHWLMEAGIGDAHLEKPLILGHEAAGVIASGERAGTKVAIDPAMPCGMCEFCVQGYPNLCGQMHFGGHGLDDGAMRQYIAWPRKCLFPLPDELSAIDGAMLEPLGVAMYAVDLGRIKPGMTVGIFGCGPIGMLTMQVARLAGASAIYATEVIPHRLETARNMGVTAVIQAEDGRESEQILEMTNGRGVDVAFEASEENGAVEAAIEAVKPGGRVVLIGIPTQDRTSFRASVARRKGLAINLVRRMKHTYPRAILLVQNRQIDLRSLVTARYSLEEYEQAIYTAVNRIGLKVIIEP